MSDATSMSITRRCLVAGRVQGVWFRDRTRAEARRLGLVGSAVNLADGRVEVVACGPPEAVAALCEWLHEGPPLARVDAVECEPAEAIDSTVFVTG